MPNLTESFGEHPCRTIHVGDAAGMLWPQCQVSEQYRQDVADCGGQPIEREVS
jgi:hypothetical protein